jgi:hypothetical protein
MDVATLVTTQWAHPQQRNKQSELESVMTAEGTHVRTVNHSVPLALHSFLASFYSTFETGCGCQNLGHAVKAPNDYTTARRIIRAGDFRAWSLLNCSLSITRLLNTRTAVVYSARETRCRTPYSVIASLLSKIPVASPECVLMIGNNPTPVRAGFKEERVRLLHSDAEHSFSSVKKLKTMLTVVVPGGRWVPA